ncbi:MAG: tetratricopeptide repeat protein [Bacteroidales bacterium]
MHTRRILHICFAICVTLTMTTHESFSQTKKHYYEAYLNAGDSCLNVYNYYGAHQAYKKALTYKHETELLFRIAEACRMYQNYADAEKYYKQALDEDSTSYPNAVYHYAEMLKYQGKYDLAAEKFKEYYSEHKRDNSYYSKKAYNEIEVCDSLVETIPTLKNISANRIENSHINSMYSEYSPKQYSDSLFFFGSVRAVDTVLADTAYKFNNYWHQLLVAERKDSTFSHIREIEELQDDGYHIGNISFNRTGDVAFFTKCKDYNCSIYKAAFNVYTQSFSKITELPRTINKPGANNTTPHLSYVGASEILFFASDRKGGHGGLDIWYSFMNEDGSFERPQNCGESINTIGNDITPYYDVRDSLLYFSSEWHTSLGGYDVFTSKVNWKDESWSPAKNLGKPVNSNYNDLYYNFSQDSMRAYWVSNRTESTKLIGKAYGNDIYHHPLVRKSIMRISDLVPIYLYFDNDAPNPNTLDTISDRDFIELYLEYMNRKDEYIRRFTENSPPERYEYDLEIIDTFFDDLKSEFERLFLFAELLEVILEDGQDIVVVFKGYASPVGNTQYNENLAKRRISCIQNFFDEFNDSTLNKYTQNKPGSGKGSLKYGHEPIGETVMDDTFISKHGIDYNAISDGAEKRMSVYSPAAAYQRKIEIVAVNIEYEDQLYEDIEQEIKTKKKSVDKDETDTADTSSTQESIQEVDDFNTEEDESSLPDSYIEEDTTQAQDSDTRSSTNNEEDHSSPANRSELKRSEEKVFIQK